MEKEVGERWAGTKDMDCVDEVAGRKVDLSLTGFVDDVCELFVARTGANFDQLLKRAVEVSDMLGDQLNAAGYSLNRDKAVIVMGFKGKGMMKSTRDCMMGKQPVYGCPARVARYLGPQVGTYSLRTIEVSARTVQMKKSWQQLGQV